MPVACWTQQDGSAWEASMTLILVGALLIVGGVLFMAVQPILRGRLSRVRPVSARRPGNTLEPEAPARGFSLGVTWPGLLMIAIGAGCLLVWSGWF